MNGITLEDQNKAAILVALGDVKIPRGQVIKICEEQLVIRDNDYNKPIKYGEISGRKKLQFAIQDLYHKDRAVDKNTKSEYCITDMGRQKLMILAKKIDEYICNGGEQLLLTDKMIRCLKFVMDDIPSSSEEDAKRLREFLGDQYTCKQE